MANDPPIAWHTTIRAAFGKRPFLSRDQCSAAWARLRQFFPTSYAAVLMPNHAHLLLPSSVSADRTPSLLRQALEPVAPGSWERAPNPTPIPDSNHLARQIRYVALNPCRASLCDDPLKWEWSTHLDSVGWSLNPWVPWSRLAPLADTPAKWHAYISGDPSAGIRGTPVPGDPTYSTGISNPREIPLAWLAGVILLLTHSRTEDLGRRRSFARTAFLEAATRIFGFPPSQIQARIGPIRKQSLQAWKERRPTPSLDAAILRVLADRRALDLALRAMGSQPRLTMSQLGSAGRGFHTP